MKSKEFLNVFNENINLLQCPICKKKFSIISSQLKCQSGHSFDFAKEGYVNFVLHSVSTRYDKQLFQSRREIYKNDFFKPLKNNLLSEIVNLTKPNHKKFILDAGCGEGQLFIDILKDLKEKKYDVLGTGIDISKHGIKLAGKADKQNIWLVADFTNIPVKRNSIDIVLNILSPANYQEFNRVLKKDGYLIKVVPGSKYLQELRTLFKEEINLKDYSNENVIKLFSENINLLHKKRITEVIHLEDSIKNNIIRMTPLLWKLEDKNEKIKLLGNDYTLDLIILIGRPSK